MSRTCPYNWPMHVWRDRLNRWFEPLAHRTPLSPNAITGVALLAVVTGAVLLACAARSPWFYVAAVPVIIVGGLLDAMDGIVARVQGKQSRFGDLLDHFCDRVADLTLVGGWCIGASVRIELTVLAVITVSLHGYLGTQIEATYGTRSYEGTGRGEFILALIIAPLVAYTLARSDLLHVRFAGLSVPEWITGVLALFALIGVFQRFRMAVRLSS